MEKLDSKEVQAVARDLMPRFEGRSLDFSLLVLNDLRRQLFKLAYSAPLGQNQEEEPSSSNS